MRGTLKISNFIFFFIIKIKEKMTSKGAINVETLIVNAKREKQQTIIKYFLIFVIFCSSEILKNNIWLEVKKYLLENQSRVQKF